MYINASVQLSNQTLYKNGVKMVDWPEQEELKSLFKKRQTVYPKFYKMDNLCKLGILSSELLLEGLELEAIEPEQRSLVIQNAHASLDTDQRHQSSISNPKEYFPSPAVFVYTLSNIVLGEMAIRYNFKGENACTSHRELDIEKLIVDTSILVEEGTQTCMAGWLNFYNDKYDAILFLIETTKRGMALPFSIDNLTELIHK